MLRSGNGDPARCAENLVRLIRGTVPYVRCKGMQAKVIDLPVTDVYIVQAEAYQVIRDFEPRIDADAVTVSYDDGETGDLGILVQATR